LVIGAGLVDADEEERHALGARALQGREPVGHLLDRGAERVDEAFEVVAGVARGLEQSGCRASGGAGEVVGQPILAIWRAVVGLEAGEVERGLQQLVLTQQRDWCSSWKRWVSGAARGERSGCRVSRS
jgi:hypothetical protein